MTSMDSGTRSRNYLNQLKGSVLFKALAVLASFVAIPLMISYLGTERFGVWSTLLTVMSWVILFDLGIGNGVRNKVAEALAEDKPRHAAEYIGAGYKLIGLIALAILIVFEISSFYLPWQTIFNTTIIPETELRLTVQIAAGFLIVNFWIGLITALLGAIQKNSMLAAGQLISNGFVLSLVYVLTKTTGASLVNLAMVYGAAVITANILLTVWFFKKYPYLIPKISSTNKRSKSVAGLGLQFFIIQIAVLVIFTTDKMLITQLLGPTHVTDYEVVFKLFSLITFAHTLISAPLWSAYTESFKKNELPWISAMLKKQLMIFIGVAFGTLLVAFFAERIIKLWIDTPLMIPTNLVVMMVFMTLISTWNNIFAMFINGTGLVKPQLYTSIVAMFLNIPLSIYFVTKLGMGTGGVVLGTVISLLGAAVVLPIQTYFLLRRHNPVSSQ